jgi:potassium/chloride transporter 4/5/6
VIPWPAGWRHNPTVATDYIRIISLALAEEKAVVCPRDLNALPLGDKCPEQRGHIDLWWFITDGGLLVLLTWLLAQHRVWRNCSVRVFVVVENVETKTAEEAAQTVRNLFKEKRILANVTVEAVVLSDEMVQPYTYDLTLKMDNRKAALGKPDVVPHSLDELFFEAPTPSISSGSMPKIPEVSDESGEETKRDRIKKILSKALHPRRSVQEYRRRKADSTAAPTVRSVTEAFARKDTITVENEKDLLDSLNDRCRLRRQTLDAERKPSVDQSDYEDESPKSTIGDLPTPSPLHEDIGAGCNVFERLNQVILSRSRESSLVLMNLPDVWGTEPDDCASYLAFCECLVKGLDKVVFVHSSGTEVVRIF